MSFNSCAPKGLLFIDFNHFQFLPHVEGLRGIAVLAVLLFHFNVSFAKGGYVGVDIFFTISGFLITSILLKNNGNVKDLGSFFTKRFFRLYPASAVTIIISLVGTYLLFPDTLALLAAKSALSSQLLASNIYFHANTDYFDERSNVKPLLHLWSLSVEEQFYLIWAPLVVLIIKYSRHTSKAVYVLLAMAIASFCHAEMQHRSHPSYAFFELPPRVYQFAIGAITALVSLKVRKKETKVKPKGELLSFCYPKTNFQSPSGNVLSSPKERISNPIFTTSNFTTTFSFIILILSFSRLPLGAPPRLVLPTNISTAIIISSPGHTIVSQLLSLQPIRFLGKISYSTYLVHWPLYVFAFTVSNAIGKEYILNPYFLTMCSVFFGYQLFTYIETPFRSPKLARRNAAVLLIIICTLSLITKGIISDGFSQREGSIAERKFRDKWTGHTSCQVLSGKLNRIERDHGGVTELLCGKQVLRENQEVISNTSIRAGGRLALQKEVVLFGDSYVRMWASAFGSLGNERGVHFRIFHLGGCPLVGQRAIKNLPKRCQVGITFMWVKIRNLPKGTFVGLSFPYFKNTDHAWMFESVLTELRGRNLRPFAISIPPGISKDNLAKFSCIELSRMWIRRLLFHYSKIQKPEDCIRDLIVNGTNILEARTRTNRYLLHKKFFLKYHVPYIDIYNHLCDFNFKTSKPSKSDVDNKRCGVPADFSYGHYDIGYQRDLHHISPFGAFSLRKLFKEKMLEIGALPNVAITRSP